jgi:hypothetical protein
LSALPAAGPVLANLPRGGDNVREWMDANLPWWVLGVIDWPRYRLFGRCWPCGRLMILHTPWALFVCERVPMPIEITEQGMALLQAEAELADLPDTDWKIAPAPQATA